MYNNNWEELSNVLEENRNLTIAIEKLKSQKGQRESEVKFMEINLLHLVSCSEINKSLRRYLCMLALAPFLLEYILNEYPG